MAVLIGQAGTDENGKITGGKAGDQTGKEVYTRNWWAMGWTQLVRPKTAELAEKIAANMEAACKNENIGYDQSGRLTLYEAAKAINFNLAAIKTPCECDCSALVAICVIAAGISVNPDLYTGNEVAALQATGKFEVLTASKYLTESNYLKRGDILVKQYSHTVVVLSDGSKVTKTVQSEPNEQNKQGVSYAESLDKNLAGTYEVTTALNMRAGAGTNHKIIEVLPKGAKVQNYGYYTAVNGVKWLYVAHNGKVGFCSSKYLKKI